MLNHNNKQKKFVLIIHYRKKSKDKLKEIDTENLTCYCFDDVMRVGNINFDNILLDEKSRENSNQYILTYNISYKTFMGVKTLCIRFDKIDGFIKIYNLTRYLVLFGPEI